MRRGAPWLAVLGSLALVVAVWVTTAAYVPPLRGAVPSDTTREPTLPRTSNPPDTQPTHQQQPHDLALSTSVIVTIYILLSVLALGLLLIVWHRVRTKPLRRSRALPSPEPEVELDPLDVHVPRSLSRSVDLGLEALGEGEPRNAIVRCWMTLETAAANAGLPRDPALTSEELTEQVISRYAVSTAAIEELAGLYREARFSEHELDERHRTRAVHALHVLRDELDEVVRARQPEASTVPTVDGGPA